MRPAQPISTTRLPGVVDTLSSGFDHVNRILWIVSLPILVDVFLWLTPRLSAAPFLTGLAAQLGSSYATMSGGAVDPTSADQVQQVLSTINDAASSFNAWTLVVAGLVVVPSLAPPSPTGTFELVLANGGQFLGAFLGLAILGALLGCAYLGLIAQEVRDGKVDPLRLLRRLPFFALSAVALVVLAVLLFVVVSIPIGLVLGVVRVVVPGLSDLFTALVFSGAWAVVVLAMIYLFFAADAIVLSNLGPIRASVSSARVVARNFWGAVGFILVFLIVDRGLSVVWGALSANPAGTLFAIIGNAYVASGLAAASLQYYQTRLKF